MNYIVVEGVVEGKISDIRKYHAGSKARNDVIEITNRLNFKPLQLDTLLPERQGLSKVMRYFEYRKNSTIFKKTLSTVLPKDTILIQFHLHKNCWNLHKIFNKYNKQNNIVLLIHDLEFIRAKYYKHYTLLQKLRIKLQDKKVLKSANFIISHNKKMTEELIKLGIDKSKITNLEIFDYVYDGVSANVDKRKAIIVAGDLSAGKAKYLSKIKNLKNVNFNLYGANFDDNYLADNISYRGKFLPDELIPNLEGSFGLVWDGDNLEECSGTGNYQKFNNPHKTSLYIAAGLPVIIWKEAALSEFIIKNNLGIAVDSLYELEDRLKNISDEEYAKMLDSVKVFSHKIRNGEFLKNALAKIIKD